MKFNETSNFKGTALSEQTLRSQAPSIFASGPMQGVSSRYTFVPTARIVDGFRKTSSKVVCPIFIATVVGDCVRCGLCAALIPKSA